MLEQYEGVVSADTGHISTHEAGAIEASAHKVLAIPHKNGKVTAKAVKQYFAIFMQMATMNIWYFREWCIFPIRQNTVHFTVKRNWKSCL